MKSGQIWLSESEFAELENSQNSVLAMMVEEASNFLEWVVANRSLDSVTKSSRVVYGEVTERETEEVNVWFRE